MIGCEKRGCSLLFQFHGQVKLKPKSFVSHMRLKGASLLIASNTNRTESTFLFSVFWPWYDSSVDFMQTWLSWKSQGMQNAATKNGCFLAGRATYLAAANRTRSIASAYLLPSLGPALLSIYSLQMILISINAIDISRNAHLLCLSLACPVHTHTPGSSRYFLLFSFLFRYRDDEEHFFPCAEHLNFEL